MYKTMKTLIQAMTLFSLSVTAYAGVSTSGGGYAVVCRSTEGTILSAELLDLFEARESYDLSLMDSANNMFIDYRNSARNTYELQASLGNLANSEDVQRIFAYAQSRVRFVDDSKDLPRANDLGDVADIYSKIKSGCGLEQIAHMNDETEEITILSSVWRMLNTFNQAALFQHELFYNYSRQYILLPEKSSHSIRRSVGLIFSAPGKLEGAMNGIPAGLKPRTIFHDLNANSTGRGDSTAFYSFSTGEVPVTRLQFTYIGGRVALTKTFVDVPQRVNYMDKFPINGLEFKNWSLVILPADENLSGIKYRIYNQDGMAVVDITQ